ncbi:Snf7 [Carpediemonas membranifera]|uniref:Snf7 n=1 Tax=Carpediemonas membranifera TaxID=201153 RepID=A0A8J6APU1_9EUKA|nr:Snf7 [Carpediemonas membranifera]QNO39401.1 vacuolar protein sorting 24B [Carpediemonas membranifera]|eukprot:KAG9390466.1 Snf7 [Carpediemonas membranifera]
MGLFGKNQSSAEKMKEQSREWKSALRGETRTIDRQIRTIQREMDKVKGEIRKAAQSNDLEIAKILAKEVARTEKAVERLYVSKSHVNSVMLSIQQAFATSRMVGAMESSSEVMEHMTSLVKLPEIRQTMMKLSKEMAKSGFIEEMVSDSIDDSLGNEEEEEVADSVMQKVLMEVAGEDFAKMTAAGSNPVAVQQAQATADAEDPFAERARGLGISG